MDPEDTITMTAEDAVCELSFVADVVYRVDHPDFNYARAIHTGNYYVADMLPLDDNLRTMSQWEVAVPIRKEDVLEPVWDKDFEVDESAPNLFCYGEDGIDPHEIKLRVSEDDKRSFDKLPQGPSPKRVLVTDLDSNQKWLVERHPCALDCFCGAKAVIADSQPWTTPEDGILVLQSKTPLWELYHYVTKPEQYMGVSRLNRSVVVRADKPDDLMEKIK